jgi:hypothetical protein
LYIINTVTIIVVVVVFRGVIDSSGPGPPQYRGFTITLRHTTLGRTPLNELSVRRRDLYLTTHNTHNRQTSMPLRRDSNPQSQQASCRRCKSLTARPLGPARYNGTSLSPVHFEFMTKRVIYSGKKGSKTENHKCTKATIISLCFLVLLLHCISLFAYRLLLSIFLFHCLITLFCCCLCLSRFSNLFLPSFDYSFTFSILWSFLYSHLSLFFVSFNSVFLSLIPYICEFLTVVPPSFITTPFSPSNQHPQLRLAYATGTNADSQHGVRRVQTFTMLTP